MNNTPMEITIHNFKQNIITICNNSGIPPVLLDSILCSVLVELRGQEILETVNEVNRLQIEVEQNMKNNNDEEKEEGEE